MGRLHGLLAEDLKEGAATSSVRAFAALDSLARALERVGLRRAVFAAAHVVRRVAPVRRLEVELDGLRIGGGLEHRRLLETVRRGAFEPGPLRVFRSLVPPGGAVVDVGANIGIYTVVAAQAAGPRGRVLALEPDPATFLRLAENVRANGFAERVHLRAEAAGAAPGEARLHRDSEPMFSTLSPRLGDRRRDPVAVPVVRLDDLDGAADADVVKIDVAGTELDVLRGMEGLLARRHARVLVEVSPVSVDAGLDLADVAAFLRERAYRVEAIDDATGALVPPQPPTARLLATPE